MSKSIFAFVFTLAIIAGILTTPNASAQSRGTQCPQGQVYDQALCRCVRPCPRGSAGDACRASAYVTQLRAILVRMGCTGSNCSPATRVAASDSLRIYAEMFNREVARLDTRITRVDGRVDSLGMVTATTELELARLRAELRNRPAQTARRDTVRITTLETKRDGTDRPSNFGVGVQIGYAQGNLSYPTIGVTLRGGPVIAQVDIGIGGSGTFTLTSNCAPKCGSTNPSIDVPSTGSYRRLSLGGVIPLNPNIGIGGGITHVSESARSNADFSFGSKSGFGGFGHLEFRGSRFFGNATAGFASHANLNGLGLGRSDGMFVTGGGGLRF